MACLSNAYFSPPENTVWWGDRPLDWVKLETCIIFSTRREGDCVSFMGKLMAYPLRDVGINCNTRDRVRGGGTGQQSPATLWEPKAAWPTCKNSPEFSTRLCTYRQTRRASFSRNVRLTGSFASRTATKWGCLPRRLGAWVRESLGVLGPAGVVGARVVSFSPSLGL